MKKFFRTGISVIILCFLSVFACAQFSRAACCLQVTDENGKVVLNRQADKMKSFAIRFIHSVALSPVTDFYIIKDCKIYLDKTIYHDFGAGLPHMAEPGQTMRTEGGEIILDGFNRELQEFDVRIGRVAKHALLLYEDDSEKAHEVPLDSLSVPGKALNFRISENCPG